MQLSGSSESAEAVNVCSNEEIAFTAFYLLDSTKYLLFGCPCLFKCTQLCFEDIDVLFLQREECESVLPMFDLA